MKGRKPKPTKLRLMQGNPGKRPINKDEPQPPCGSMEPPKYLSKQAKKVWGEVAPELFKLGLLTILDRQALARYCVQHSRWMAAEKWLDENTSVHEVKDDTGLIKFIVQAPQISLAKAYAKLSNALGIEFGLTPSARVRLHTEHPGNEGDKEKEFFG